MVGKDIRAQVFHSIQVKVLATFLLILLPVYVLGAVIFHWTYLQMHQQIIRSQMALLDLYAETIDDEISRIRLLEYNCINDDDLVYLANAYPILDTFERSQYLLRAQHRLQVMKTAACASATWSCTCPPSEKASTPATWSPWPKAGTVSRKPYRARPALG